MSDPVEDTAVCYRCNRGIDIRTDEWWQYSWEERASEENIEKAIEDTDFRDWVRENYVLCPNCHERVQMLMQERRTRA